MDSTAIVTATAWVPRGFAAQFPLRKEFDEKEFERIAGLARLQLDDAKGDMEEAKNGGGKSDGDDNDDGMEIEEGDVASRKKDGTSTGAAEESKKSTDEIIGDDDDLRAYNLDTYDDTDDSDGEQMGMFKNIKSLAYHQNGEEDPYITLKDDEDTEEREELQVLPTDNLLLVAKSEDEVAHLEVYVYEDEADNLYVHHDIMLPAIPLCVEWLDIPVNSSSPPADGRGNFAAIGTMDPDIEIWDLDVVDCMYPNAILGPSAHPEEPSDKKKKKKKKKSLKANDKYHVDAVLALSANRSHRNLLASASADKTVKLWDLSTQACAKSYSHHTDKVCALAWHPKESTILLSGSYDRTIVAADMRAPEAKAPRWGVESDVENVRWDPHNPNYFYISTESGMLHFHDARMAPSSPAATKPIWALQAHDKSLSAFDINPIIPGYLATGSFDKTVKLWDIAPGCGPSMVVSRDLGVGKVFSLNFAPDKEVGFRLGVAGSKGTVQVWDTSTNAQIRKIFKGRVAVPLPEGDVKERLITVQESSDEESDEEEEEGEQDGGVAVSGTRGGDGDSDDDGEDGENDGWESMDEA